MHFNTSTPHDDPEDLHYALWNFPAVDVDIAAQLVGVSPSSSTGRFEQPEAHSTASPPARLDVATSSQQNRYGCSSCATNRTRASTPAKRHVGVAHELRTRNDTLSYSSVAERQRAHRRCENPPSALVPRRPRRRQPRVLTIPRDHRSRCRHLTP